MQSITWRPRTDHHLAPLAMVLDVGTASILCERLIREERDVATLEWVRSRDLVVILGDDLPWIDGTIYLGRETPSSRVLIPTFLVADAPLEWIERRVLRVVGGEGPVAVVPQLRKLVPLAGAGRVDLRGLHAHAEQGRA